MKIQNNNLFLNYRGSKINCMLLQNKNTLNQSMAAYGKKFKNQPLKNFLFICIVQQN